MKKIFLLFGFINSISLFAQECKFSEMSKINERGKCTSYEASDGFTYKIGDKIKIGVPSSNKTFAFIQVSSGLQIEPLTSDFSGNEVEIKRIGIAGSNRIGYSASIETKGMTVMHHYFINMEKALETGEVVGNGMSGDKALSELKKAKDKLDLGLISQEDFDKLKDELKKFIDTIPLSV